LRPGSATQAPQRVGNHLPGVLEDVERIARDIDSPSAISTATKEVANSTGDGKGSRQRYWADAVGGLECVCDDQALDGGSQANRRSGREQ
jgi:hypothetical protein